MSHYTHLSTEERESLLLGIGEGKPSGKWQKHFIDRHQPSVES